MREDMCDFEIGAPAALVQVVAVFGEAGEIDDAEVGAAGAVVGLRLSV